jgi:tRNA(Ile)-lysidine synthase
MNPNNLYRKFNYFVNHNRLFSDNHKILLAVSGGIDSMAMMHLFSRTANNCIVAHCNFQLRGAESNEDELFVEEQAGKLGFGFYTRCFDTKAYAERNKLSIQMAARELRYNWFRELCKTHNCHYVAVAHNRDDVLETFMINLGRGTGIKGLTSIKPINDDIVRPLLFASRKEIEHYIDEKQIPYREDSSNSSDKYLRNFIRHKILPLMEVAFPNIRETLSGNISKLNDLAELYDYSTDKLIPALFTKENKLAYIHIEKLLSSPAPKTLLYEILSEFGFSPQMVQEIYEACFSIPGKHFYSAGYKLVKDRDYFIISPIDTTAPVRLYIEQDTEYITQPINLKIEFFNKPSDFIIEKDPKVALLDADKVAFPIILRKWANGDYFIPLGMNGFKKLSDFFIDRKLSIIDKENTWLLTWIIGMRIDDRFKVFPATERILKISIPS